VQPAVVGNQLSDVARGPDERGARPYSLLAVKADDSLIRTRSSLAENL
jgi:hypothetical protein